MDTGFLQPHPETKETVPQTQLELERKVRELEIDIKHMRSDIQALEGMQRIQRNLLRICDDEVQQLKAPKLPPKPKRRCVIC